MSEVKMVLKIEELSPYSKHRFLILITASILISFVLVAISMALYNSSGAAQLDLSRPGYVSIRSQAVTNDNDFENYASTGAINQKAISEFKILYSKQATKTKAVDAFGGDPLNFASLGLELTTE